MKKVVLYTNEQAAELKMAALDKVQKMLLSISEFLVKKVIAPDSTNIQNAVNGNFDIPVENFKQVETEKIKKIIDAFGESAITDGWELKVNEKSNSFKNELINQVPKFEQIYLVRFFSFENGITVKPEFDKQYFIDKNSVILSDPNQIEEYETHCKCCEFLNKLFKNPDNEFMAMDKYFHFNTDSKEFEMKILPYHDVASELEAIEKKKKDAIENQKYIDEYNRNQQKLTGN